jgi:hypothetical protein
MMSQPVTALPTQGPSDRDHEREGRLQDPELHDRLARIVATLLEQACPAIAAH